MTRRNLLILAAAVFGFWWWRRKGSDSKLPLSVNASPNVVVEDDTAEAIGDLVKAISTNPDLRTNFAFFGNGVDVTFSQSPPPSGIRYAIGGQPTIILP